MIREKSWKCGVKWEDSMIEWIDPSTVIMGRVCICEEMEIADRDLGKTQAPMSQSNVMAKTANVLDVRHGMMRGRRN